MPAVALLLVAAWLLARPPAGAAEAAALALLAAYGLTPFVRLLAIRGGVVDRPDDRKRHPVPTPKLGGVAVIAAFVLALGRRPLNDPELLAIALAALALMVAGACDDTRGLPARLRLLLQAAGAAGVIAMGVRLNLFAGAAGDACDVLLSAVWIVGITNAYNFIDGIDGLAAALGALIAALLAVVAHGSGQAGLETTCLALAGALLGFLPHNLKPGRPAAIFLGDSGSASVGFLLAALAIKGDWADGDPLVALSAPVLIFSVPIYDMIRTTITRIVSGRVRTFAEWIDYVGRDHIHHRLTDLLGGSRRALALILVLALALGLSAIGLHRGAGVTALLFLLQGALVLLLVEVLERAAARTRRPRPAERRAR